MKTNECISDFQHSVQSNYVFHFWSTGKEVGNLKAYARLVVQWHFNTVFYSTKAVEQVCPFRVVEVTVAKLQRSAAVVTSGPLAWVVCRWLAALETNKPRLETWYQVCRGMQKQNTRLISS